MRTRRYWALAGLSVFYLASRLPFLSATPYEWDSVNYALAVDNFSIPDAQPHFPGYIFYVLLAKLAHFAVQDPLRSVLAVNLFLGLAAMFSAYRLGKLLHSGEAGVAAAGLFVLNPLAWFYGEVAEIYLAEAALSGWVGFLLLKYYRVPKEASLLWPSLALGLSGGFRPSLEVFLLPLWVFVLFRRRPGFRALSLAFALAGAGTAVWLWPTLDNCGGFARYQFLSNDVVRPFLAEQSFFYGAPLSATFKTIAKILAWGGIFFGPPLFAGALAARRSEALTGGVSGLFGCLMAWVVPALLFFTLFYLGKPGYLLFFLPPVAAWSGVWLTRIFPSPQRLALAVAVTAIPGLAYFFSAGVQGRETELRLSAPGSTANAFRRLFRYTLNDVQFADQVNRRYTALVHGVSPSPDSALFVFTNFSEWRFRQGTYYFRRTESHFFRFDEAYRRLNHLQYFYGRTFELSDNGVEVRGRPLFVFASKASAHGAALPAFGAQEPVPGLDCHYFPPGSAERILFEGSGVTVEPVAGVVYPR